jgi:hypothetical protein
MMKLCHKHNIHCPFATDEPHLSCLATENQCQSYLEFEEYRKGKLNTAKEKDLQTILKLMRKHKLCEVKDLPSGHWITRKCG